jgi:uncharacterized protein YjiK
MFIIIQRYYCLVKGKQIPLYIFLSSLFLSFTACKNDKSVNDLPSPPEYDLNHPAIIRLPGYLDEISGIAYYPKDKTVFAISDEKGWLYKIFLSGRKKIQKWKYAPGADFEDLVLVDSTFYVLQSNGNLLSYKFFTSDSVTVKTYNSPIPGKNEFEILYWDREQHQLIMLCKDCEADNKNSLRSWAFDLTALTFLPDPAYIIDVRQIEDLMQEKKVKFKPSAAAIQPGTGRLFIISSINKVLVIADRNGNPEKVYRINPKLYKQPEGLTFTPGGDLLISNESADVGSANILIFKYTRPQ